MENTIVISGFDFKGNKVKYNCFEVPVENENYCKIVNEQGDLAIVTTTPHYGGGWSTSNTNTEQFLMDSKIIKLIGNVDYLNKEIEKYNDMFPNDKVRFDSKLKITSQKDNDEDEDEDEDDDNNHERRIERFLLSTLQWNFLSKFDFNGFKFLEIEFIPSNEKFYVAEYDGFESIRFQDDINWIYS